jgi:GntR family transcriptional regulator
MIRSAKEARMTDPHSSTSATYISAQQGDAWAMDAASRGQTGTQRLIDVSTGPPPPDVQTALNLADGEPVVSRRRLILADGQAVELASSYYPATIAGGTPLAEKRKIKGGAVTLLNALGYPLHDIVEHITARLPEGDEADLLSIAATEPLVILTRIGSTSDKTPVECAINRMVASRIPPLTYRMRATA